MFANSRTGSRPPISSFPPSRPANPTVPFQIMPEEVFWKSQWPFKFVLIISILLLIFSIALIGLDIALMSVQTTLTISTLYTITTYSWAGVYRSAVGVWGGVILALIAIDFIIPNCTPFVTRFIRSAGIISFLGIGVSIALIGINAARIKDVADLVSWFPYYSFGDILPAKLSAAELALSVVTLVLCLILAILFCQRLHRFHKIGRRAPFRPQV